MSSIRFWICFYEKWIWICYVVVAGHNYKSELDSICNGGEIWEMPTVMFEVFPFEHKTERNEWSTLLSSTVVNTSARKAGGAWFDSMPRESIILLFRSVVISSRCYFGDKNKTNYNERENHNNGALAGNQHTALPRVALHVIPVEGGTCYFRSVPLRK